MIKLSSFPLIFAPMEGITDRVFRNLILDKYPDWDYLFTDFLRLSTNQTYSLEFIKNFLGPLCPKVILQILTTPRSTTPYNIGQLEELRISWLDLNFGCPSKQVISHQGGSYLLSQPKELQKIVHTVRQNFSGTLSAKIRSGFKNDQHLSHICKILEDEGVDLITLHPRLQTQLYKGQANWEHIIKMKKEISIPLIGNGDITNVEQMNSIIKTCDGVMIGRGAIRRPWLAQQFKSQLSLSLDKQRELRLEFIQQILEQYSFLPAPIRLKKIKKLTHYLFDPDEAQLKNRLLRTATLEDYLETLLNYPAEK
jgi:tRNA-dihydrouridine synthase